MSVVQWVSEGGSTIPTAVALSVVVVAAVLDSALGLVAFVPAAAIVVVAAAGQDAALAVVAVGIAAAAARSIGDGLGFASGRRHGAAFRESAVVARLGVGSWDAAGASLDRRGPLAELLIRLVPMSRALVPAVAGARGMGAARFVGASLVASCAWSALWVAVGVLARGSFHVTEPYLHVSGWVVLGMLAAIGIIYLVVRVVVVRPADGDLRRVLGDASVVGVNPSPEAETSLRQRLFHADEWRTIPNLVSAVRILLLPVFGILLFVGHYWVAIITLLVVFVTDFVDGFVARRFNQTSALGAWLDPVADRLTVVFVVAAFAVSSIVPWQLVVILLIPDVLSGTWAVAAFHGSPDVRVSKVGKVRTALLFVGLFMMLFGEAVGAFHAQLVSVGFAFFVLGVVGHYLAMTRNARGLVTLWQRADAA